jgi:hypothetical protein
MMWRHPTCVERQRAPVYTHLSILYMCKLQLEMEIPMGILSDVFKQVVKSTRSTVHSCDHQSSLLHTRRESGSVDFW